MIAGETDLQNSEKRQSFPENDCSKKLLMWQVQEAVRNPF